MDIISDFKIKIFHNIVKLKNIKKSINKLKQKNKVELLEFHIVEHCNLNCKSCVHFTPLAEEEFLDIEIFANDIKQLAQITKSEVKNINIFGGEPLLHKDLLQFLNVARLYFPNTKIKLITNGILLLNQNEEFWNNCRNNDIIISMTKYPLNLDYDAIQDKANLLNVKIEFFSADKKNSQWHFPLDLKGKQNKYMNFINCQEANHCTNVYKGKLYVCPIASNMRHFNKFFSKNIPITEKDYLDIYKIKSANEITKFCSKPTPICSYCKIKERTFDNDWSISKKNIEEWL